jgi:hypothetical protein
MRAASAARPALAAVVTAVLHLPAVAGLPDWAKPIAASAPDVPSGSPKWPTQTLLSELRVTVGEGGGVWRVHERVAEQYLSNRVDTTQVGLFAFNSDMKMKTSRGWHILPGERAHRNIGGAIDVAVSSKGSRRGASSSPSSTRRRSPTPCPRVSALGVAAGQSPSSA